jgi:hypothetical protein
MTTDYIEALRTLLERLSDPGLTLSEAKSLRTKISELLDEPRGCVPSNRGSLVAR